MKNKKKNLIVTLADKNYLAQAKQLFSSLYFNSGWTDDYMLITHNLDEGSTKWFEDRGILVYSPPLISNELIHHQERSFPPLLLSEFYLFTNYFKQWDTVIFLDSDIIVTGSLDKLLNCSGFSAMKIESFTLRNEFTSDKKKIEESGIEKEHDLRSPAFNSGVFVIETSIIQEDWFDKLIALHNKYKTIGIYGDEPILNLFFYKNWNKISAIYNLDPNYIKELYGIDSSKFIAPVIHCGWSIKPWNKKSPYYDLWLDNLIKADRIDLNCRLEATRIVSDEEEESFIKKLKYRKTPRKIILRINKNIGRIGLLIKDISPQLYEMIKLKRDGKK